MGNPLSGKVSVVTGGSRGLGREMVLALAEAGSDVVIASRKLEACEELASDVRAETGRRALAVACNVGDWAQCEALVEAAYGEFGTVDVLINNAGMSLLYPSLDQVSEAMFDKVIATNLKGPFRLSALIGARMAAAGGGSIVNISSIEAAHPEPMAVPYAAAKAGVEALSVGLARTYGPAVRVNTIRCGPFDTDIAKAWPAEMRAELARHTALGRIGVPADIVGAALFFASDASTFCTGATLALDGGFR
ncbi:SDR family NAD(P)-dependent oxidoreductase [Nocardia seriolae]|uniref:3-oxoacyl-[acyl-carrier-protein] reductase n=1 Tax=Nocardia seriolae TaxID=37332 RepID=A0ABC8AZV4_9NOCA|nr:glucose 1-dehydrogenase [Nocardia seriolae]APA99312.1 3-oxoacyl-[acyl-carrier-protein] reductase [Nocardia seriolae]MTJ63297.1 glucose 1-dehydrogenase [Nocardia seriolae]MTJ71172.1 glucose 1-dehydrogenase [Nocardia seriolae]MTJ88903.1 glucose 1-dehydrogenase [Nocardia seriolae]MTK32882.1 glucose 1-dehydrogenase [Nocardia seriolae]